MDLQAARFAVEEPNLPKSDDQCVRLSGPVCRQFDVLRRHTGQVAIGAVGSGPQEQTDQPPRASRPKAAHQFLGLVVSG